MVLALVADGRARPGCARERAAALLHRLSTSRHNGRTVPAVPLFGWMTSPRPHAQSGGSVDFAVWGIYLSKRAHAERHGDVLARPDPGRKHAASVHAMPRAASAA